MSYAQIDDKILDCPKAQRAGEDATNLLIRMVIYCNSHLTDGTVPKAALSRITSKPEAERVPLLRALKNVDWLREKDDEFEVVGYLDHNPSRKQVESRRKGAKRRKDKWKKEHTGTRSSDAFGTRPGNSAHSTPLHSSDLSSPIPPIDANPEGGAKGKRKRRDLSPEALCIGQEIALLTGTEYPPASFDALEARLHDGDMSADDALLLVRWAAKDKFWGGEVKLSPSTLFRPKHYAELLAKAKASASGLTRAPASDGYRFFADEGGSP